MVQIVSSMYFVALSTLVILVLTVALASLMTKRYVLSKHTQYAFWAAGLWLFAFGVLLETLFAIGVYGKALYVAYFTSVAVLVELLALGSVSMLNSSKALKAYSLYSIAAGVAVAFSAAYMNVSGILVNHVVYGVLPLALVATSSAATFPAAIILLVLAAKSYIKRHSRKMLSIMAGVVVVSSAGTLYIAAFPAFLYYSEFIGILLLWLGFI